MFEMNRRRFLTSTAALLSAGLPIWADGKPNQILVIRHAEKNGSKADIHLNARGVARAAALPALFPARFATPEFLFASRQSKHSNRPVETLTPLSKALRVKIDTTFPDDDYAGLAKHIFRKPDYAGKTLLICWHHDNIPSLARTLGIKDAPWPWPPMQFDRVWRITYPDGVPTLANLPQQLLPGDLVAGAFAARRTISTRCAQLPPIAHRSA
jgi:phosphohistidine phosphatase SixA